MAEAPNADLAFLLKTGMELAEIDSLKGTFSYITEKLKDHIGNCIVGFSTYDAESETICTCSLSGLGALSSKVAEILGVNPVGVTYKIPPDVKGEMPTGELELLPGKLCDLTFGQFPKAACKVLEELFDIREVYAIGVVWKGKLYGSASLLLRGDSKLKSKETIKIFVEQASITLQRLIAEEQLQQKIKELKAMVEAVTGRELKLIDLESEHKKQLSQLDEMESAKAMNRQAELEFSVILDSSPIIVFYKDVAGKFIRVNMAFAEALKVPKERFVGKTVFDFYSKKIAQGMTDDDQEVIKSGKPKLNIVESYESAGGVRWVKTDKVPILDKNKKVIGLVGFAQDMTDTMLAEEKLKEKINELNIVNETAMGRELRLIELEKEVNSLLGRLGQAPKYK